MQDIAVNHQLVESRTLQINYVTGVLTILCSCRNPALQLKEFGISGLNTKTRDVNPWAEVEDILVILCKKSCLKDIQLHPMVFINY